METQPQEDGSEPKKPSAIEFAKEKLRINPEATYAEMKAQAKFEGIPLFPVVYGRAKALLGLVPTAPYGSKSKARKQAAEEKVQAAAAAAAPAPMAPVAPAPAPAAAPIRSVRSASPVDGLEAMITDLRDAVQQRDQYRNLLLRISKLIAEELKA